MPEKNEPLKGKYEEYAAGLWWDKIANQRLTQEANEVLDDVKSAVQGLIKDVEEDIVYWKKEMEEYEEKELNAKTEEERKKYDEHWKIAEQVYRVLNTRIKNLIKKWFADVVEG